LRPRGPGRDGCEPDLRLVVHAEAVGALRLYSVSLQRRTYWLVVTAVRMQGRSKSEVARDYKVSRTVTSTHPQVRGVNDVVLVRLGQQIASSTRVAEEQAGFSLTRS
jgi:hypothetical protein